MDCCICSPMIAVYRPPRNTICPRCYEGAKSLVEFLKDIEGDRDREASNSEKASNGSRPNSSMGMADAFKRMKEMKEEEEGMSDRLGFVDGLVAAFKERIHTDILVQPGTGPPIPAHRAVLATRSEIFRTVLSSDECKAPAQDTISLPELSYEELQCLLEFLYCGTLKPDDRVEKHACSLLIAADKYDIPFLKRFCEARILRSLGPSNALQVLSGARGSETDVKHLIDISLFVISLTIRTIFGSIPNPGSQKWFSQSYSKPRQHLMACSEQYPCCNQRILSGSQHHIHVFRSLIFPFCSCP